MSAKYIHLTGYFDHNFGDDMMMRLIVRGLPEITFLVEDTVDAGFLSVPNVAKKDRKACSCFPKLVVTGSGFMINTKEAFLTELIWLLKRRHPGDYCLGCNMEPLDNPAKEFLIRRKLNKFKLITCRDQASYRWLRRNTCKPEIHHLPDILFSMPDAWLPKDNAPDKLGISLMHRAGDRADCAYYRAMAEIADEWVRKTGKGVTLLAFNSGKEDDLFACHAVRALMRCPEKTEIVAHGDGAEIPAAFSRCERIIGARFHSMVLALRMGIPFFPIVFRDKMRNLIHDLRYPLSGCAIDHTSLKEIQAFLWEELPAWYPPEGYFSNAANHCALLREKLKGH